MGKKKGWETDRIRKKKRREGREKGGPMEGGRRGNGRVMEGKGEAPVKKN